MTAQENQDELYRDALQQFGSALDRLARAYEADPDKRRDLTQEIHLQIWRSLPHFDARCSMRTWVYRVAHNAAATHVMREHRTFSKLVGLETLEGLPGIESDVPATDRRLTLDRLSGLIRQLKPLDRQIIVSYLEDMDAQSIGEITGLSSTTVAMRIHRIKKILAQRFRVGKNHE